jgi:PAS domain S-box-containing protein
VTDYRRIILLILTMSVVVAVATAVAIGVLYETAFERQRQQLVDSAHTMARLLEGLASFDERYAHDFPGDPEDATLAQIREAFTHEHGVSGTTEVTLGRRDGDRIVFLMRHHHVAGGPPDPVLWGSGLSEPMQRALSGERGTMNGADYHGADVLAAYDHVVDLGLGVVAKIDLAEIRAPFLRAGLLVAAVALVLIAAGTVMFLRLTNPMLEALRERQERLGLILSSTVEGIFGIDLDGRCTFANEAAVAMLGYEHDAALLGRDIHELIHHTRPDGSPHPREECPTSLAIARGESLLVADEMLWRADGTAFPAEYRTHPMRRDGRIVGAVVSFEDTTERRDQEAQLAHAQKMEVVGTLTGGIAHDFNNLLTIILGNLRLLGKQIQHRPIDDAAELLDDALSAAEDGAALTGRLLTFSRKRPLSPEIIELGGFLHENLDFLRSATGDAITIRHEPPDSPLWVSVDVPQLESALLNLAVNARDAMPTGGVLEIALSRETTIPGGAKTEMGPFVAIRISDTGEGMTAEVAARAIEPFYTTKEAGKGSGLGLSMVYGFARQSGGDLRIESAPGRGTTVTLYLPEAEERSGDRESWGQGDAVSPGSRDDRILVVEDEERVRRFAARTLQEAGYRIFEAADAEAAKEILAGEPGIRLVFSDVVMPGVIGGRELGRWVRVHHPATAVLLTTGYSAESPGGEGDFPLLPKPYGQHSLLAAVRRALDANHSRLRAG